MKSLKIFVIMGLMLLFGGTCFAQQEEEFQRDSIWGISVDTTETDVLLHFFFSAAPVGPSRISNIYFAFLDENGKQNRSAVIQFCLSCSPVGYGSKYADTIFFNDNGRYYEIKLKMEKIYYGPKIAPWNTMKMSFNEFQNSYTLPLALTALNDVYGETGGDYCHKYVSMMGYELNEPPHVGYYIDCLFSRDNQVVDCKKCLSR